jgi:hypothetical protein
VKHSWQWHASNFMTAIACSCTQELVRMRNTTCTANFMKALSRSNAFRISNEVE